MKFIFLILISIICSVCKAQTDSLSMHNLNEEIYEAAKNDNIDRLTLLINKKDLLIKIFKAKETNNKSVINRYTSYLKGLDKKLNNKTEPVTKKDLEYTGKRLSLIYSPAISFPHISYTNGVKSMLVFSINNNISFDYRINNKYGIGINYKNAFSSGKNNYRYIRDYNAIERHQFNSNTVNIFVKIFVPKNKFSSVVYIKPSIGFQLLSIKNYAHIYDPYGTKYFSTVSDKRFDIVGNFSVGKNWTIKNSLLLGFEVKTGLAFGSIINTALINNTYHYREKTYASRYNIPTEILQIGFNIGFLAF